MVHYYKLKRRTAFHTESSSPFVFYLIISISCSFITAPVARWESDALLLCTQRETFESNHGEFFARLFEIIRNGELGIADEFLVHQAVLFIELGHTTVSDVLYHLLGQIGCFLLCSFLFQCADSFCVGLGDVSFA